MQSFNPLTSPLAGQLLIEASAGTGKTWSIGLLYLRLLLERNLEVDEILVVTFTTAATAELRDRVRTRIRGLIDYLEQPGSEPEEPVFAELTAGLPDRQLALQRLRDSLTRMDEAAIFTIHGFCQRMLQEHAFESNIPFGVEFIESEELLRTRIMEDFWRQRFYPAAPVEAAWARNTWEGPEGLIRELHVLLTRPRAKLVPAVSEEDVRTALAGAVALWHEVRDSWVRNEDEVTGILRDDPCLSRSRDNYGKVPLQEILAGMAELASGDEMPWLLPARVELLAASEMADRLKGKKVLPDHRFFELFDRFYQAHDRTISRVRVRTLIQAAEFLERELVRRKEQLAQMYFNDLLTRLDSALDGPGGEQLRRCIRRRFKVAMVDEFQDTDPVQYRIFHALFGRDADEASLFMIGDPKQSIYSFRGADIFAYIRAARDTAANLSFTMDTNYRASSAMVAAVNRLFDRADSFVFTGEIDFYPVRPREDADAKVLKIEDIEPAPLQIQLLAADRDATPGQRIISKDNAGSAAAAWSAGEIARLLELGRAGRARIGERDLAGGDIAVLVRTHLEADQIRLELQRLNIASVYFSRDSVFQTDEAGQIYRILAALLNINDEAMVRTALAMEIFGLTAADLDDARRDRTAWVGLLAELEEYGMLWKNVGLTGMFHRLLSRRDVVRRFAGLPGGERFLTNLLHLVELLQEASVRLSGEDLLCWFREQMVRPEPEASNQQLRLESDEDLVKIVTIHKAKGLEYPVVFLPFLWSNRVTQPNEPFACHVPENGSYRLLVDLGSDDRDLYARAEKERLAEDLRLLYVALTRACYCCYVAWGLISKMETSALAWLLHRDEDSGTVSGLSEAGIKEDLEALNRSRSLVSFVPRLPGEESSLPLARAPLTGLTVRRFNGRIDTSWVVTSYSGLSGGSGNADHGGALPVEPPAPDRELSVFTFPRGAAAGNFLHGLLESFDFSGFKGDELRVLVEDRLVRSGFEKKWTPVLTRWLSDIVTTPLDRDDTIRLAGIAPADRQVEMGFYFGLRDFDPARFNGILRSFDIEPVSMAPERLQGLMKGYIDIVFRHNGKYYILDYKSNYLGPEYGFYRGSHLDEAMREHRYDLQYLIYTVALHRYLRFRMKEYDYDRCLGGVFYLFLRGMQPEQGAAAGVWSARPDARLIVELDRCFSGEGPDALPA